VSWQAQTAKAHFSELLKRAETEGPQTITKHGRERAVVVSIDEYHRLIGMHPGLRRHLLDGPRLDDLHIERDTDTGRDLAL
jgi:antitoxin Phd